MRELSLHVLDVVENGLRAGASHLSIEIVEDRRQDRLCITMADDGSGMDAETARRALDPFYTTRTSRRVGLGLPLLAAAAERCAGRLTLESTPGQGTVVWVEFQRSHIDRAPLGDIAATLMSVLLADQKPALRYVHEVDGRRFEFDTAELRAVLEDVPLDHPDVRKWLEAYIREGEASLEDECALPAAGRRDQAGR